MPCERRDHLPRLAPYVEAPADAWGVQPVELLDEVRGSEDGTLEGGARGDLVSRAALGAGFDEDRRLRLGRP